MRQLGQVLRHSARSSNMYNMHSSPLCVEMEMMRVGYCGQLATLSPSPSLASLSPSIPQRGFPGLRLLIDIHV